jgi:hypothetical protein
MNIALQVSRLAHGSILKMDEAYSSETSVDLYWSTQLYIPEGRTLHSNLCKKLRNGIIVLLSVHSLYLLSSRFTCIFPSFMIINLYN